MPRFISTNKKLKGGFKESVDFRTALLLGQAPDEGLFVPETLPQFPADTFSYLKGRSFAETAYVVMRTFLNHEIPLLALEEMTKDAYQFEIPLEFAAPGTWLMRLDQGPTASFKDVAAQMLARFMSHLREPGKPLTILVATSGDTGSAIGEAFSDIPGIRVVILYPKNEVSPRQKMQLDTMGANVQSVEIDGKFDDCQNIVKAAFSDPELEHLNLTSANSINFGRILPQMTYYVHAYAQLADEGEEVVFSIPSGNFGNALGCELARRMGLPVKKIILATNENNAFPRFLSSESYEKISPSRTCISNAMNVGHPSNLARFFHLFDGTVDKNGKVHRKPKHALMKKHLWSTSVTDSQTCDTMKRAYTSHATLLEPHGAVAWHGLEKYREETGDDTLGIILETAHPAKFPEVIREVLGIEPELPASLEGIADRLGQSESIDNNYESFKTYLAHHYASALI